MSASLTLTRRARTAAGKLVTRGLVGKRLANVKEGDDRLLTLLVPRRVARGPARLTILPKDVAGNSASFTRAVTLGKA